MAKPIWIGGAPAVAQIDTAIIPADVESGQTVTFSIGNKTLEVPLTGSTAAAVATELADAWNASTIPEFAEITAAATTNSSGNNVITLTSDTAGKPFVVSIAIGSGNNEKQVITLGGTTATGGTFTLTFNGETTTTIAYNAAASTVQTALEGLASYSSGDFTVTGDAGGPYTIEFTGTLAATNVSLITASATSLTGSANEEQTVTIINSPSGGDFTLSFNGQTTASIAYNAAASAVQTALEGLSGIKSGDVSVTGSAGGPWAVEFTGDLAKTDVSTLVANSSLTGAPSCAAATTQAGSGLNIGDLIAYWKCDETSGDRADYTGNHDLAETGTVSSTEYGIINRGLSPGGSDASNYLDTPHKAALAPVGNFSISAWFNPTSEVLSNKGYIISKGLTAGSANNNYSLAVSSGYVIFRTSAGQISHSTVLSASGWYHVVGVVDFDNSLIKISLNGGAFETQVITDTAPVDDGTHLTVGIGENTTGNYIYPFVGTIDEISLWPKALSASEVTTLYNSGSGLQPPFDGTNEVQTLTFTGTPTSGSVGVSFRGSEALIPYDSTAAEAEALLEALDTVGTGNVSVTGGDWPGTALTVEFINDLGQTDVPELVVDNSSVHVSIVETTKGVAQPTVTIETTAGPIDTTTTTANSGPNNWDVAANWSTNTVPVASDTVYIADSDVDILYGLDQSSVTLTALHIEQTFTGTIGLPRLNTDGTNSYYEYREQYLKIGATELFIGEKEGDGSERIKINLGSAQTTVLITDSGDSPDGYTPPILLLGTHASNVVNVNRGFVGIGYYPTETATVATLRQAFIDDAVNDTTVYVGEDVTLTNVAKSGGTLTLHTGTTTFEQTAGETTIFDGAHTVLDILSGTLYYNSTGTLSAVNLSGDAVLSFNQDRRPKDVTVINKYSDDSEIYDESGCIASPVIDLENCGDLSTLFMGKDFKLTFGATT